MYFNALEYLCLVVLTIIKFQETATEMCSPKKVFGEFQAKSFKNTCDSAHFV